MLTIKNGLKTIAMNAVSLAQWCIKFVLFFWYPTQGEKVLSHRVEYNDISDVT